MPTNWALDQWTHTVRLRFSHLSAPQATVLALLSFALVFTQSCGRTTHAAFLANVLGDKEATLDQRLGEWIKDAPKKRGAKRRQLDVTTCFAPLLRWILAYWPHNHRRLVLVLDATLLGANLVVLAVSVVYRGCAIPIAWKVLPANQPGAWKPHWLDLLDALQDVIPADWLVLVLADRGLYAPWLFARIVKRGWHPFLRIQRQGLFREVGTEQWRSLRDVAPRAGTSWAGEVICFKNEEGQLRCSLLARWDEGYKDPWLVVTDLLPEQADVVWYGLRSWIEAGFKDVKRGGWHWEQTKMRDPARVERFWLAIAVATLWAVSVGGAAEAEAAVSGLEELPPTHIARRMRKRASRARLVSCFRRGVVTILGQMVRGVLAGIGYFEPEEWPRGEDRPAVQRTDLEAAAAAAA